MSAELYSKLTVMYFSRCSCARKPSAVIISMLPLPLSLSFSLVLMLQLMSNSLNQLVDFLVVPDATNTASGMLDPVKVQNTSTISQTCLIML